MIAVWHDELLAVSCPEVPFFGFALKENQGKTRETAQLFYVGGGGEELLLQILQRGDSLFQSPPRWMHISGSRRIGHGLPFFPRAPIVVSLDSSGWSAALELDFLKCMFVGRVPRESPIPLGKYIGSPRGKNRLPNRWLHSSLSQKPLKPLQS